MIGAAMKAVTSSQNGNLGQSLTLRNNFDHSPVFGSILFAGDASLAWASMALPKLFFTQLL
jgi:hypothetical protein